MGYFTLKIAVVAALLLLALIALPLGALAAMRRARRACTRPAFAGLTGTAAAAVLLHREKLAHEITVESCHDESSAGYAPRTLRIRLTDHDARGRSLAALGEAAFAVARATLHADGDPDFLRQESRATPVAILANALPVAAGLGLVLPSARGLLLIVTPVLTCCLAGYTLLSLPAERRAADRALGLLRTHGLLARDEQSVMAAYLRARAALALARPVRACVWIAWAL